MNTEPEVCLSVFIFDLVTLSQKLKSVPIHWILFF